MEKIHSIAAPSQSLYSCFLVHDIKLFSSSGKNDPSLYHTTVKTLPREDAHEQKRMLTEISLYDPIGRGTQSFG